MFDDQAMAIAAAVGVVDDDLGPFSPDVIAVALARLDGDTWSAMVELRESVNDPALRAGATIRAKEAIRTLLITEDPTAAGWNAVDEHTWYLGITYRPTEARHSLPEDATA